MQAAEGQLARRLALGDPGEGAQIADRQADYRLLRRALDLIGGDRLAISNCSVSIGSIDGRRHR